MEETGIASPDLPCSDPRCVTISFDVKQLGGREHALRMLKGQHSNVSDGRREWSSHEIGNLTHHQNLVTSHVFASGSWG